MLEYLLNIRDIVENISILYERVDWHKRADLLGGLPDFQLSKSEFRSQLPGTAGKSGQPAQDIFHRFEIMDKTEKTWWVNK